MNFYQTKLTLILQKMCKIKQFFIRFAHSVSNLLLVSFNIWRFCSQNLLLTLTILSVIIGLGVGAFLRHVEIGNELIQSVNFPGEIFLRILKMLILPLIFSSLIAGLFGI
jgi:L-cystine uptake protein TcyP (sodium:dicarboxylate symporter family)